MIDEDYESDESFNSSLFYENETKPFENNNVMNDEYFDDQDDINDDDDISSEFIPDTDNSYTSNKKSNKNSDKKPSSKIAHKKRNSISQSDDDCKNKIKYIYK